MNVDLIIDAKKELTLHLIDLLRPHIYEGIRSIWITCKTKQNALWDFQEKLEGISVWNQDIIDKEYNRMMAKKDMDFLDKLLDMIYIGHTKTFTSLNNKDTDKIKITLDLPSSKHFIHRCYVSVAREFWQKPRLIDDREKTIGSFKYHHIIQQNTETCLDIINKAISKTIRELMPLKTMLEAYSKTLENTKEEEDKLNEVSEAINEIANESLDAKDEYFDDNNSDYEQDSKDPEDEIYDQEPAEPQSFRDPEPNLLVGGGKDIQDTKPLRDVFPDHELTEEPESYDDTEINEIGDYEEDRNDDYNDYDEGRDDYEEDEVKNVLIPSENHHRKEPFFEED